MSDTRPVIPRFDSPEQEAYLNLWRTYDRLRGVEEELFQQQGLTAQQYNALRLLRHETPNKLATLDLASRLISRAPDITRLLNRLVERKLIERVRLPGNKRVVEVGITSTGLALLRDLDEQVRAMHKRQLGHLSPQELQTLIKMLHKTRRPHEDPSGIWG